MLETWFTRGVREDGPLHRKEAAMAANTTSSNLTNWMAEEDRRQASLQASITHLSLEEQSSFWTHYIKYRGA
jgi:hypothetical protein